jgi:outer membrane protein insertion porin family
VADLREIPLNQLSTEITLTMEATGLPTRMFRPAWIAALLMAGLAGCTATQPRWIEQPWTPIESAAGTETETASGETGSRDLFNEARFADADGSPSVRGNPPPVVIRPPELQELDNTNESKNVANRTVLPSGKGDPQITPVSASDVSPAGRGVLVEGLSASPAVGGRNETAGDGEVLRGQDPGYSPQGATGSYVPPSSGQPYATLSPPVAPQQGASSGGMTGTGNQVPGYFDTTPPPGNYTPPNFADIDVLVRETQTGKMTFGAAYNSNSGLVGQIIIDERNFDILGFPRSFQEIVDGTAWRGRGQGFRLELVPGNEVQRYLVSFTEPYLFNSQVSFSASGYFFDRRYFDWDEQRLGGRLSLGYRLTPDLSFSAGLRMENVDIHDPRVNTSPSLNAVLGDNSLYLAQFSLINDTRDHPFMASAGSYLELSYHQGFGDFSYPRGDLDYRRYFLITQRPDGSGRHTLSLGTRLGVSGTSTPVYENYFAGGFSTLRGFSFRGASPVEGGARVGGRFQWLNTAEYTFPITADDMFKGVLFCDFGTVEQDVEINADNFRVAPGFGFRVHMPVGGAGGAPLAFDFAFPVNEAATDDRQVFSFYMGVLR